MELGLSGRWAIVCASSRGLGRACALALAQEGVQLVINGLTEAHLSSAEDEIHAATGQRPRTVLADVTTDAGRAALLAACPEPDILVNNNAGPAPGTLEDWDHATWMAALESNMLAGTLLIRAVLPGMRARGFGRIINITSAMVKSPQAAMGLSAAARAGLTAFSKAVSRDVARDNVTINSLMPEKFDTDRIRFMTQRLAHAKSITDSEARERIIREIPARRLGRPEEFGAACAFLCSVHAGYITGQSLQMDGGAYNGLF